MPSWTLKRGSKKKDDKSDSTVVVDVSLDSKSSTPPPSTPNGTKKLNFAPGTDLEDHHQASGKGKGLRRTRKAFNTEVSVWSNNFLSNWFYLWVLPIVSVSRDNRAEFSTVKLNLRNGESSRVNTDKLEQAWYKEVETNKSSPMFRNALVKAFGAEYFAIAGYKIAWTVFTWAGAWYLLKLMLMFLQNKETDLVKGHMLAFALLLVSLFSSIAIHQQYGECNRVGVKVKGAITGLVYRKSLKVSTLKGGAGEVINILSTDVTRINDCVVNFHFLWAAFMEVVLILAISIYEIRLAALPALGFIAILLPVQFYLGKLTNDLNRKQTATTTERVHVMSEILTAIKLIKFYAWEAPFTEKILEIRKREMKLIYDGLIVKTINFTVVFAIPVLVALTCLSTYVAMGNVLTASVSFTVLSVFNTLRYPFFMLPMAVKSYAGALTAFERLEKFLQLNEVEELKVSAPPSPKHPNVIEINDSDFKWDGSEGTQPTLSNISVNIKKGSRVAIVGDVGSGKSSILAALLGQIRQVRGDKIKLYGTTAYMSQEAWILNLTLRDNILFGKPLETMKYQEVIRVAGLQRDLTLLLAADQTEIAERGANLSGGQRQRVSLARTVYYDAEIVLLDDPLSAVDQHVGRHIFEECFLKYLGSKTLIVALNQLQYLCQFDHIIFVENGIIRSQGTYDDLMANDATFNELVSSHVADGENSEDDDTGAVPMNATDFVIPSTIKLNDEEMEPMSPLAMEEREVANLMERNGLTVRSAMSVRHISALNENTIRSEIEHHFSTAIPGAERSHNVDKIIAQNEMSVYSMHEQLKPAIDAAAAKKDSVEESDEDAIKRGRLVTEDDSTQDSGFGDFKHYAKAGSGPVVTIAVMLFFILVHGIRIGGDFWLRLWVPKIGGFSDAVYIGVYGAFTGLFTIGAFFRGFWFSQMTVFKAAKLHDALFDAVMHAPMAFFDRTPLGRILSAFSKHQLHVDDTMLDAGLQALQYFPLGVGALILCAATIPWNWAPAVGTVIFGYLVIRISYAADIKTKSREAITKPPIYAHLTATLEGLFSVRAYHAQDRFDSINLSRVDRNLESLFAMQGVKSFQALYLDFLSSLFIYFAAMLLILQSEQDGIDAIAGLALSNALQMLVFVQWTVRMWGEVETQMSSVGQLVYYAQTEPEAPFEIPDRKPPSTWPSEGRIKFEDVVLKYQKNGVAVLKNVSCTIHPTEKIGIVGRTGSGKSTLLVSLLRIVESCEGKITIDGLDVSTIGLHDLRNKVAIIPQEPVMFVGTLRSNLDPFFRCTDEEIWKALDAVQLGEKVRNMPSKLDTAVTENGKSVSQGQRQLICIARAILSKAKILVLDEATASLDAKTDLLIQEAIKKNFADLTMLTIAHRLNTIIECDRVLVMDAGKIMEFDEPINLLKIEDGVFRSLVEQTGEAAAQKLRECAEKAHEERVAQGHKFIVEEKTGAMTIAELASTKNLAALAFMLVPFVSALPTPENVEDGLVDELDVVELIKRQAPPTSTTSPKCHYPTCYDTPEGIAADMKYCDYISSRLRGYNPCTDKTIEKEYNERCIAPVLGERYGVMPFTRRTAFTAPAMTTVDHQCWSKFNTTTASSKTSGQFDCLRAAQMVLQYGKSTLTVRVGRGKFTSFRPASMFTKRCEAITGVSFNSLVTHFVKKKAVRLQKQYRYAV
ncbi:Multidrug resistance-associated protein 1 [Chytridiales sp. JEL 0842]|nr:Multidrug resistance-associated protein 1 [Chytridiales sp. JEL 0842]